MEVMTTPSAASERPAANFRRSISVLTEIDRMYKRPWGHIVKGPFFENGTVMVIVVYVAWLGVDIDLNRPDSDVPAVLFEIVDNVFCGLFSLELLFRFYAYRRKRDFFLDKDMRRWNMFDSVLVLLMVVETWVLKYIAKVDVSELQMFSVLRLLRLLRVSRLLRHLPELRIMVLGLVEALRSVAAAFLLGVGFMYIWSIVFTQWAKSHGSKGKCIGEGDAEICLNYYFGSLAKASLTFFQILVFDDTFELVRPIIDEHVLMGALIILYILLECYTILSMLIGIICEIVSKTTKRENRIMMEQRIKILFENMDSDGSKCLSREEFNGEAKSALLSLGLDSRIVAHVFDLSDVDRSGSLDIEEFMTTMQMCTSPPTGREVQQLYSGIESICRAVGLDANTTAILKREKGRSAKSRSNLELLKSRNDGSDAIVTRDVEKVRDHFSKLQAIIYRAELDAEKRRKHGVSADTPPAPMLPRYRAKWLTSVKLILPRLCSQLHALRAEYRYGRQRLGHTKMPLTIDLDQRINDHYLDEVMTDVIHQIGVAMRSAPTNGVVLRKPVVEQLKAPVTLAEEVLSPVKSNSKLPTTTLKAAALPGSSLLNVENSDGFEVGDFILIGTDEIKTIAAISSIIVSTPLTKKHDVGTVVRKLHVKDPLVRAADAAVRDLPDADPSAARQRNPKSLRPVQNAPGSEDLSSDFDMESIPTDSSLSEVADKFQQLDEGVGAFATAGDEGYDCNDGVERVAVFPAYRDGEAVEYYSTTNHEWIPAVINVQVVTDKATGEHTHFVYNVRVGRGYTQVRYDVTLDLLRLPPIDGDLVEAYKLHEGQGGAWVAGQISGQPDAYATTAGYHIQLTHTSDTMQRVAASRIRYRYKPGDIVLFFSGPEVGWIKASVDHGETTTADGCGAQEASLNLAAKKFYASGSRSLRGSTAELNLAPRHANFQPKLAPWTLVPVRSAKSDIKQFAEVVPSYFLRPQNAAHQPSRILMRSSNAGQQGPGGLLRNLRKYLVN